MIQIPKNDLKELESAYKQASYSNKLISTSNNSLRKTNKSRDDKDLAWCKQIGHYALEYDPKEALEKYSIGSTRAEHDVIKTEEHDVNNQETLE